MHAAESNILSGRFPLDVSWYWGDSLIRLTGDEKGRYSIGWWWWWWMRVRWIDVDHVTRASRADLYHDNDNDHLQLHYLDPVHLSTQLIECPYWIIDMFCGTEDDGKAREAPQHDQFERRGVLWWRTSSLRNSVSSLDSGWSLDQDSYYPRHYREADLLAPPQHNIAGRRLLLHLRLRCQLNIRFHYCTLTSFLPLISNSLSHH